MSLHEAAPNVPDPGHSASGKPVVSIVVVTFNSAAVVAECLAALPAAVGALTAEYIVVDNASQDGTAEAARAALPAVTVSSTGANVGYGAAINHGVRLASPSSEAVLVLNPDVRLSPDAVPAMLEVLRVPGTGIATPKLVAADGALAYSLRREPTPMRAWGEALLGGDRAGRWAPFGEFVLNGAAYEANTVADWATGAAMLISRACLGAVGEWEESYFLYSEETDFALRARDAGFVVRLAPDAVGVHLGGESNTSPRLYSLLTVNRVRLYRRRHSAPSAALFTAGILTGELLRAAAGRPTSRAAARALLGTRHSTVVAQAGGAPPAAGREARETRKGRQRGKGLLPGGKAARLKPTAQPAPVVCFSAQDFWYHNRAHSDIQLMTRVAASRPVLFVNSLTMRMPLPGRTAKPLQRIIRKARSMSQGTQAPLADAPAFNVFSPFLVPLYGNALGRRLNAWLVRRQVAAVCRRLGIQRPVYFVTMPTAWDVVRPLPRAALLYNRSDKHSAFKESNQEVMRALEDGLMRHADRVLYVSHELMSEDAAQVGERGYFLGHGVDLDHFRAGVAPIPDDLASIPGPRIGFFGGLDDFTVDFDLLEHVAREMPNASLVLIGDATGSMERFEGLPNVHWLGFRPYETIPAYGSGFDVAIMPWLRNDWIRYCNPIKLKEYLALGLPVVTTEYPEIAGDRDIVRVAADPDEFVRLIQATLDDGGPGDPERRRAHVEPESWAARTAELLELMDKSSR